MPMTWIQMVVSGARCSVSLMRRLLLPASTAVTPAPGPVCALS